MGIVLGIIRSRWHVPVQTGGLVLAITGHLLGHAHGGREFRPNAHSRFANLLVTWLLAQVICGLYLKLHLKHKCWAQIRTFVLGAHAVFGIAMPILSWIQVVLGGFTAAGICHGSNTGQCVARIGSGNAIIGVGLLLLVFQEDNCCGLASHSSSIYALQPALIIASSNMILLVDWFYGASTRRSFLDIISIGLIWLFAIALAIYLDQTSKSRFLRKYIIGILLFVNGWYITADRAHDSSMVLYGALGFSIQIAGVTNLIADMFTDPSVSTKYPHHRLAKFSRLLTSYFLTASGFLFMGTNKEQMRLLSSGKMPAVAYVLFVYGVTSLAFSSAYFILSRLRRHQSAIANMEQSKSSNVSRQELPLGDTSRLQCSSLPSAEFFDLSDVI
ncbi:hypothetical protein BOTNAR_0678g00080 [Botryotinia narcissicola]|uniref:Cytochrome b561 domain-containing protein n=1 Tax=Botryotinia narcissicola TaxID=278944 RepID=A0A4Z1H903_9HELO|nr:hypothetical protein BOTNAR_0678g00080 [Botryotinia narcissicola]